MRITVVCACVEGRRVSIIPCTFHPPSGRNNNKRYLVLFFGLMRVIAVRKQSQQSQVNDEGYPLRTEETTACDELQIYIFNSKASLQISCYYKTRFIFPHSLDEGTQQRHQARRHEAACHTKLPAMHQTHISGRASAKQ